MGSEKWLLSGLVYVILTQDNGQTWKVGVFEWFDMSVVNPFEESINIGRKNALVHWLVEEGGRQIA